MLYFIIIFMKQRIKCIFQSCFILLFYNSKKGYFFDLCKSKLQRRDNDKKGTHNSQTDGKRVTQNYTDVIVCCYQVGHSLRLRVFFLWTWILLVSTKRTNWLKERISAKFIMGYL